MLEKLALAAFHKMDPEVAHGLSLKALRTGLAGGAGPVTSARLKTQVAGLELANPIGLAAGYDKNAVALGPLSKVGFGFLEVGAATPRPQAGNPKPRLYRLRQDRAVINRFGFNNEGIEPIAKRLAATPTPLPRGLNLGANKDSQDRVADFGAVLRQAAGVIDFATVNVSSPNTEKLRDLQGRAALDRLLAAVMEVNAGLSKPLPIFLKIAPDLSLAELDDVAEVASGNGLSGIIAANTTLGREGLTSPHAAQAGGLSGEPLFNLSTRILAELSQRSDLPLIGVGGVGSAEQAYQKIRAGACAIQLYSALVYSGLSLIGQIAQGLDDLLARDGFACVEQAVGSGRSDWLG